MENHLLANLPNAEIERWQPQLQLIEPELGQVLHESAGVQSHVYFPTTAIVSLLYVLETGASAEIAVVGNEGLVGISCSWAAARRLAAQSSRAPEKLTASRRWH